MGLSGVMGVEFDKVSLHIYFTNIFLRQTEYQNSVKPLWKIFRNYLLLL